MPRFWDLLKTEEERNYLRSFMPVEWNPDEPFCDLETLEEIDRLMRQKPKGELAAILAGSHLHFNN